MLKTSAAVTIAATAAAATNAAITLDHSAFSNNTNSVSETSGLISASSNGGDFRSKTVKGVSAVGVKGGSVSGEIDNNESIVFSFSEPVFVTSLSIAHLYTSGNFGDNVDEAASFFVASDTNHNFDPNPFTLTATNETTGDWTGLGALSNDDIANSTGGGAWTVSGEDIFGAPITSLSLGSANPGNSSKGDFGFVSITVTPIPAPGALALVGVAGFAVLRRRK